MTTSSRALVLSGGGNAGQAWMAGIISGLRELGADLGDADLIVGTSAGARTGAQLATGAADQMIDMYRRSGVPDVTVHATLPQFLAASMRIIAEAPDEEQAARRIAAMGPLGRQLASGTDPPPRGRRADPGPPVAPAAAADRGCRRGIWPPCRLQRRLRGQPARRGDGQRSAAGHLPAGPDRRPAVRRRRGAFAVQRRPAAGHDVVTVLSPIPLNDYLRAKLDAEIAALGPATVHVVTADEELLAAIGPDPLAAETAQAVLDAGAAQARREISALQATWPSRARRAA